MNNEFSNKAQEIQNLIKQSKNVLLHCHPYPDPDSIGSVLAMTLALKKLGKGVTPVLGDSDYPQSLESLPHRDLIISKSISQINFNKFDLFIILDSSTPNQITQLQEISLPKKLQTIVIDHHKTNLGFGKINFIDKNSSSTCQILYLLFKNWGIEIDKDMALYLFLGIYADSGGFKYQNSTSETIRIASELANIQPDYHKYIFNLENSRKPIELEMMGLALSTLETHFSNKVILSAIPYIEIEKKGLSRNEAAEGLVPDLLRSIVGSSIVASLVEVHPNVVIVSLRTRNEEVFDVSEIAKSVGNNGGGHKGAAGTTINESLDIAKKMLLDMIKKSYPRLK